MTGDRNPTGFDRVLELPVAAFGCHQMPTIAFDQLDHISNLHRRLPLSLQMRDDRCQADILPQLEEEQLGQIARLELDSDHTSSINGVPVAATTCPTRRPCLTPHSPAGWRAGTNHPDRNQMVRAAGKKAEITPSPVEWMFGGVAHRHSCCSYVGTGYANTGVSGWRTFTSRFTRSASTASATSKS